MSETQATEIEKMLSKTQATEFLQAKSKNEFEFLKAEQQDQQTVLAKYQQQQQKSQMKGGSSFASKYQTPSVEEECPTAKEEFGKIFYDRELVNRVQESSTSSSTMTTEQMMARILEPEDSSDHMNWEAPEANGYEFQSEDAIDMLKQLFQQLQTAQSGQLDMIATVFETCIQQEGCESLAAVVDGLQQPEDPFVKVKDMIYTLITLDARLFEHVEQLTRTVDDKHKTAFDELSNAKNEEIAASTQQHKEKSFEDQETKLSNERKTTELEKIQESLGDQESILVLVLLSLGSVACLLLTNCVFRRPPGQERRRRTGAVSETDEDLAEAFLANLNPTQIAGDLLDCVTDFERVMGICVRMLENFMNDLEKKHLYRKFKSTKESELTTTQETLAELEQKSAIGRCCGDSGQFKTRVGV